MKLPRDLSGTALAKLLEVYGDRITRQTGSPLRLTPQLGGEHHLTIPNHDHLRIGTLAAILNEVENHFQLSREVLLQKIF